MCLICCYFPRGKLWLGIYSTSSSPRIVQSTAVPKSGGKPCWHSYDGPVWRTEMLQWRSSVGQEGIPVKARSSGSPAGSRMRFLSRSWHLPDNLPPGRSGFSKHCDDVVRTEWNKSRVGIFQTTLLLLGYVKNKKSLHVFLIKGNQRVSSSIFITV